MPALMDGVSVTEGLCPASCEVAHIFHLPSKTLLDPELASKEILVPSGSEDRLKLKNVPTELHRRILPSQYVPHTPLVER
ncbi:hypothetical protein BJV78DRAFT_1284216 [Lactifluus subvellereus]|nr:hypothetical protein BJV78DRAFT_1284216 [Lactifluus subvellereus]